MDAERSYCVYVLKSKRNGRYYIGSTSNLEERLARHNHGRERSTKPYRPFEAVHVETFASRGEAEKRERALKSLKSRIALERVMRKARNSGKVAKES